MRDNMLRIAAAAMLASTCLCGPVLAQSKDRSPPPNSRKLSEIISKVEQRPDFRYISEIEWDDGGYEVTYYTNDNAKVEIKFDPVSGETRSLQ